MADAALVPASTTARSIKLRGQAAVLSVTHPILGIELEVGAHTIRIGPEQYLALVDELCNIAFLAPQFAFRIRALADELRVPEVAQYVRWMQEADRDASSQLSAVSNQLNQNL